MRIAYLVSQYPAASHTFIRREIDVLRARGFAIDTFSVRTPRNAEIESDLDKEATGSTWFILPIALVPALLSHCRAIFTRPWSYFSCLMLALKHRPPGARAFVWAIFHFIEAIYLACELERRKVGHLHNHFANSGATVGLLASRFSRLPWSLTLHGISETDYPAGLTLGAKIAAAKFAVCVSWFGKAQAMRHSSPRDWMKLSVVRSGLDLKDPRLQFRSVAPVGTRRHIICVARLSAEKGHVGLLDAVAELIADGLDVDLTLVGDGPLYSDLTQRVRDASLTQRVHFAGRLDETATLAAIRDADILVLPSLMEGLPIVLMEAMAIGVPVVASRIAGVPELVDEEREGLLFTPGHWRELSRRLAQLVRDDRLRAKLAVGARRKMEREFDASYCFTPLADLLSQSAPSAVNV